MNQVILIGNTTTDIEVKKTQNGKSVASFTLAVSQGKDKPSDFINCVAWEKTAELLSQYVKKGHKVAVIGKVSTRSYEDKDGKKVYVTEILVREIEFLEQKQKEAKQEQPRYESPYDNYVGGPEKPLDITSDDLPF